MKSSLSKVISLCFLFVLGSCEREKGVEPVPATVFAPEKAEELFVKPGGTGTGTKDYPMGSVHRALELAYRYPNIRTIRLSTGTFTESCRIRSGIVITGGCDPSNDWQPTDTRTIIQGKRIDSVHLALSMRNISRPVVIENLTIRGESAIDSGNSSFAVYCIDMASVTFRNCSLLAGMGKTGKAGLPGDDGLPGEAGVKEIPGSVNAQGGYGGSGGIANLAAQQPGNEGAQGFCIDGTPSGGMPGIGGSNSSGQQGGEGTDGSIGTDGAGGLAEVFLNEYEIYLLPFVGAGATGEIGTHGCGGGGGGGSASRWAPNYAFPGLAGGGGGSGGGPGSGGLGGAGGGSSVALVLLNSSVSLINTAIVSDSAGAGGVGGRGGIGGEGGAGGKNTSLFGSPPLDGGEGGRGGKGGDGGFGGGGAGGWSIGILKKNSEATQSGVSIQIGAAGKGGAGRSVGNGGEDGQAVEMLEIP